jgi:hypothetical protein
MVMAHFRIPGGSRLFISGSTGIERLTIETGKRVTLELTGLARNTGAVTITQVPVEKLTDLLGVAFPAAKSNLPDVVSISKLPVSGTSRIFTVTGIRQGFAALTLNGADPLYLAVGSFQNHSEFKHKDLIAEVFRGSDPVKTHTLTRMLQNNDDNLFDELSNFNQNKWCPAPNHSCLPCGTVSKVGGYKIFHPLVRYTYNDYYNRISGMETAAGRAAVKREDVKYDAAKLKRACTAIQKRLEKGLPSVVGLVYHLSDAVRASGGVDVNGTGGHTVLIVGCNNTATKFLYIDVYPKGSKLKYDGGQAGKKLFPDACHYLGVFELIDDPARGTPVLRARPGVVGDSGLFAGLQFLEVVSGPVTEAGPVTE